MDSHLLAIIWCVFVFGHKAGGTLHMEANPPKIYPGLSSLLTIKCTIPEGRLSNVSNILSLIISKSDEISETQEFTEMISIHAFDPHQVNKLVQTNASVSGHLVVNEESFLSLQWRYPSTSVCGVYRCQARVMDAIGHCEDILMSAEVTSQQPDLDQLFHRLSDIQMYLEQREKKESQMLAAMFEISSEYKGRRFYLAKQDFRDIRISEVVCEHYGGYLAEINDSAEHLFIRNFLDKFPDVIYILLGATDEVAEGKWMFRFSRQPVVYMDWHSGEPNTAEYDCMYLHRSYRWKMLDHPCYDFDHPARHFLCEVPIN